MFVPWKSSSCSVWFGWSSAPQLFLTGEVNALGGEVYIAMGGISHWKGNQAEVLLCDENLFGSCNIRVPTRQTRREELGLIRMCTRTVAAMLG